MTNEFLTNETRSKLMQWNKTNEETDGFVMLFLSRKGIVTLPIAPMVTIIDYCRCYRLETNGGFTFLLVFLHPEEYGFDQIKYTYEIFKKIGEQYPCKKFIFLTNQNISEMEKEQLLADLSTVTCDIFALNDLVYELDKAQNIDLKERFLEIQTFLN